MRSGSIAILFALIVSGACSTDSGESADGIGSDVTGANDTVSDHIETLPDSSDGDAIGTDEGQAADLPRDEVAPFTPDASDSTSDEGLDDIPQEDALPYQPLDEPAEWPSQEWLDSMGSGLEYPSQLLLASCEESESFIRYRILKTVEYALDQAKSRALGYDMAKTCFGDTPDCLFSLGPCEFPDLPVAPSMLLNLLETEGGFPVPPTSKPRDYSDTNTQVKDVDEADFVKTDGEFVYVAEQGAFWIVDSWPAQQAHVVSSLEFDGAAVRLYVVGDRAIIYVTHEPIGQVPTIDYQCPDLAQLFEPSGEECTYGYDCQFGSDGRRLSILVVDISDRTAPTLVRQLDLSGAYIGSRRVDDAVYTFVEFPTPEIPQIDYYPDAIWALMPSSYSVLLMSPDHGLVAPEEVEALYDQQKQIAKEAIEFMPLDYFWPSVTDTRWQDGEILSQDEITPDCESVHLSPLEESGAFVGILSFDLLAGEAPHVLLTEARPGAIYGNRDALYLAIRQYAPRSIMWPADWTDWDTSTTIHRFPIDAQQATATYGGSVGLEGLFLNQFSMDEFEDHLRVAVTMPPTEEEPRSNGVFVVDLRTPRPMKVGELLGLGPNEDIRAVRFIGDTGYLVTFEKTDPLYVLDLSDPSAPSLSAELVLPGFSTYIHPMDDNHLLTIGYDADDMGAFSWFTGMRLQLFDISNPYGPILVDKKVIATRGTGSEATTNHLAFNYFAPQGLLAIPVVECEGGSFGQYANVMSFNGLKVFSVTIEDGFSELGGIEYSLMSDYSASCFNWWTQSNSQVKRSIFMDSWVYAISLDQMKIAHINSLSEPAVVIEF